MSEKTGLNPLASQRIFKELEKKTESDKKIPILEAADKIFHEKQEKLKQLEEYKNQVFIDSLTGCYNRNYFEKFKKDDFDPNKDHNYIGLVFIDLNGLKKINDTFGHKAGDNLIKNNTIFLKDNFKEEDIIIRLGGDEFVVICHNHQNDNNFETGLTNKVEKIRDLKAKCQKCPIDFAFGVAVYNKTRDLENIENTQDLADERMYQDKKNN